MAKRGLGSDNMSDSDKQKIHKMGGQASGSKMTSEEAARRGREGARKQPTEAKRTGGKNSHAS